MKVKYKEQEIDIPENATIEVVNGDLVITPKKPKFKEGDFVRTTFFIAIYKKSTGIALNFTDYVEFKIDFGYDNLDGLNYDSELCPSEINIATEEEKKILLSLLNKDGKRWNAETKQIEDILKVGDVCIFWNNDKKEASISKLCEIDNNENPYMDNSGLWFANAIKFESIEQYKEFIKQ